MKIVTCDPTPLFLAPDPVVYADVNDDPKAIPLTHVPGYGKVKQSLAKYVAPNWQHDILGACRRVYAFIDAAQDHKGLTVWLDPNAQAKELPEDVLRAQMNGAYIGLFRRVGMPSRTTLYVVDGAHPEHEGFLMTLQDVTTSFHNLTHWTDGALIDEAIRRHPVPVADLSGEHGKEKEPLKFSPLAAYVDIE